MSAEKAVITELGPFKNLGKYDDFSVDFVNNVIKAIDTLTIDALIAKFVYTPKEAPMIRRKHYGDVNVDVIAKFWIIMILRGGNKKRLFAGTVLSQKTEIEFVMKSAKVNHPAIAGPKNMYSTWQVMTSFFEIGVQLVIRNDKLKRHLTVFTNNIWDITVHAPGLEFLMIPGGLHVMLGADEGTKIMAVNFMIAYQQLVIWIKNSLAKKNTEETKTTTEARERQRDFAKLAVTNNPGINFPVDSVKEFIKTMGIDLAAVANSLKASETLDLLIANMQVMKNNVNIGGTEMLKQNPIKPYVPTPAI